MTREEAKRFGHFILAIADADTDKDTIEFTKIALKELEQEPIDDVLDKIERDIFDACSNTYYVPIYRLDCEGIFEIIDKYRKESEE